MNLSNALLERARSAPPLDTSQDVHGRVFGIHLRPHADMADCLTIGVCVIDAARIAHCRLLPNMDRLRCLYGDAVDVESFELLRSAILADLDGTRWSARHKPVSPNIEYGRAMPAIDISIEAIIERSFDALVPAGRNVSRRDNATPVLTRQLRDRVRTRLRQRMGAAVEVLFRGNEIRLPHGQNVRLPLHDARTGRAGNIVSAFTAHRETATNNLAEAVASLLAVRLAEHDRQLGLFVLQPSPRDFAGQDTDAVRARVAQVTGLLAGANVTVQVRQNADELADAVQDWCEAA